MNILLICILILFFQPLLSDSRPMISCHVMCNVTAVTDLFIVQEKEEEKTKTKEKKYEIKKNVQVQMHHNKKNLTNSTSKLTSFHS